MRFSFCVLITALVGCGGPQVRPGYEGPARSATETAVVYPSAVGALVLIQTVDGKSTYGTMYGYFGPVAVLPGVRTFVTEIKIGADTPKTSPAEMAPPPGVQPIALQTIEPGLLVSSYRASVTGQVDAGKEYELRYGYLMEGDRKQHLLWLEPRRPQEKNRSGFNKPLVTTAHPLARVGTRASGAAAAQRRR